MASRYRPVEALVVKAWGQVVGAVVPVEVRGEPYFAFEYDPSWVRGGMELAPLLMALNMRKRVFMFGSLNRATYFGLPPMLSDSLPDRYGNALIDAALGQRGVGPDQISALDRLAYVGARGMGALTFDPRHEPRAPKATALELAELAEQARRLVAGDRIAKDARGLAQLIEVGTSAGGARAKAVVAWNRTTGEFRAGNLNAAAGFEQWLLKFDGSDHDAAGAQAAVDNGRVEYAYSLMARAAGIDMAETHLLVDDSQPGTPLAHFMSKRFDRTADGKRLHMQTLCAIAGMDFAYSRAHDYTGYLLAVDGLGLGEDAMAEAFRRMVFNIAARNGDDHTKNFAFLMDERGRWTLAPAYDLTYHPWMSKHEMSVNGKFSAIGMRDVLAVADRFRIPAARAIVRDVVAAIDEWPALARAAGVADDLIDVITQSLGESTKRLRR